MLLYLIQKEFKQMMRNILLPVIFVLLPVLLMNMVPRIATQEVRGIRIAVVDNDRSTLSRRLIQKLDASAYLTLQCYAGTYAEAMEAINRGDVDAIVEFPGGYEKALYLRQFSSSRNSQIPNSRIPEIPNSPNPLQLQVSANSTNGTKGAMAGMYISQIVADFLSGPDCPVSCDIVAGTKTPASPALGVTYLYNPTLDYKSYMAPAVVCLLLMLVVGFLPALNIVIEKEKGTIEQINVSPIGKFQFIASKLIPYIIIGLLMAVEAMLAGRALHGIWPAGNLLGIFVVVIIFCMLASSIGLIVSNYSSTLQQAALTMFFFLVIFMLMSGLLTPIQSMPDWAQYLTLLNPMRYAIECIRALYLKGSSLLQLWPQLAALLVFSFLGWVWAIASYRKNA